MSLKKKILLLCILILLGVFFGLLFEDLWFTNNKSSNNILFEDEGILTYQQAYDIVFESIFLIDEEGYINIDEDLFYKNEALFRQVEDDINEEIAKMLEEQPLKPIKK